MPKFNSAPVDATDIMVVAMDMRLTYPEYVIACNNNGVVAHTENTFKGSISVYTTNVLKFLGLVRN